jgi:hypothetical protein
MRTLLCLGVLVGTALVHVSAQAQRTPLDVATERLDATQHAADQLSRLVATQLDTARRFQRTRPARCLDQVLSQVNAIRRQVTFRLNRLPTEPPAEVHHHGRIAETLRERVSTLRSDARVCVGGTAHRRGTGGTVVHVVVEDDMPNDDPTAISRRS